MKGHDVCFERGPIGAVKVLNSKQTSDAQRPRGLTRVSAALSCWKCQRLAPSLRSSDKTQILENALPHRTLAPESEANDTHREQVPGLLDFQ